jgi:hypothetical protein
MRLVRAAPNPPTPLAAPRRSLLAVEGVGRLGYGTSVQPAAARSLASSGAAASRGVPPRARSLIGPALNEGRTKRHGHIIRCSSKPGA